MIPVLTFVMGDDVPAGRLCTVSSATGLMMMVDSGGQVPAGVAGCDLAAGLRVAVGEDSLIRPAAAWGAREPGHGS